MNIYLVIAGGRKNVFGWYRSSSAATRRMVEINDVTVNWNGFEDRIVECTPDTVPEYIPAHYRSLIEYGIFGKAN